MIGIPQEVPVIAILEGLEHGRYPSISKAARTLFIRNTSSILRNIENNKANKKKTGRPRGVPSYKTGLVFNFKLATND